MMDYKKYSIKDGFKSDGCTLFPDGKEYKQCCYIHDAAIADESISRKDADRMFFNCMKDKSNIVLALITYLFVRIQGITRLGASGFAIALMFLITIVLMLYKG